jgi:hypothetical protein
MTLWQGSVFAQFGFHWRGPMVHPCNVPPPPSPPCVLGFVVSSFPSAIYDVSMRLALFPACVSVFSYTTVCCSCTPSSGSAATSPNAEERFERFFSTACIGNATASPNSSSLQRFINTLYMELRGSHEYRGPIASKLKKAYETLSPRIAK